MFHTSAYLAAATATANFDSTAIVDNIMQIQNGHLVPQMDMLVVFAKLNGVTGLRGRITSPTIRQISPVFIRPIDAALLPATLTRPADWRRNPLRLKALEEVAVEVTNSAAGPNNMYTVLGLANAPIGPIPNGDVFSMRGTGATTVTASLWSQCTITWADTLPNGRYAVVGLNAFGTTAIAARLIFQETPWRPGCVAGATGVVIQDEMFRNGGLGVWGAFNNYAMPNVEFLCNAADTAQEVYLDLIRIG